MDMLDKQSIERTMKALEANRMKPYYAETAADALEIVKSLCPEGATVSSGGSVTLTQIGFDDFVHSGAVRFIDKHYSDDRDEVIRMTAVCDVFATSANAITENGELYNIDGNGNRVSALIFGPKSVVVVAGCNKIVRDLDEAKQRLQTVAAPKNAARLNRNTPCVKTGRCADCKSPERICCHTVISAYQRFPDRIKVILVAEPLGF